MIDRAKDIRELEASYDDWNSCLVPRETVQDAIALLKAQQPRVMPLEEVLEFKPFYLWVEDLDTGEPVFPVVYMYWAYRDASDDWLFNTEQVGYQDYGKRWRFWSAEPTPEERKAVKWDE